MSDAPRNSAVPSRDVSGNSLVCNIGWRLGGTLVCWMWLKLRNDRCGWTVSKGNHLPSCGLQAVRVGSGWAKEWMNGVVNEVNSQSIKVCLNPAVSWALSWLSSDRSEFWTDLRTNRTLNWALNELSSESSCYKPAMTQDYNQLYLRVTSYDHGPYEPTMTTGTHGEPERVASPGKLLEGEVDELPDLTEAEQVMERRVGCWAGHGNQKQLGYRFL